MPTRIEWLEEKRKEGKKRSEERKRRQEGRDEERKKMRIGRGMEEWERTEEEKTEEGNRRG